MILAVTSAALYAPEHELLLAWQGPCEPVDLPDHPRLRVLQQPDRCNSYGEAYGWAVEQTDDDALILLNDDAVLQPDTVDKLLDDAALIEREHPQLRLGMLACRSNFVPGAQNVRAANGGALAANALRYDSEDRILAAERVSPIAARIARPALQEIGGFPPLNWYSDDLMCFDLIAKGYTNFVSRAYVHHVGMRATGQGGVTMADLDRAGRDWIRAHRPDFWKQLGGT